MARHRFLGSAGTVLEGALPASGGLIVVVVGGRVVRGGAGVLEALGAIVARVSMAAGAGSGRFSGWGQKVPTIEIKDVRANAKSLIAVRSTKVPPIVEAVGQVWDVQGVQGPLK